MKSIQHVLWRGALALTLMAIGIGTGVGMPPAELAEAATDCPRAAPALVLAKATDPGSTRDTVVLLRRRPLTPAG